MRGLRAGVVLPLSGRYAELATQAEHGLRAWAAESGADLVVVDGGDQDDLIATATLSLAPQVDVFFGPYGSGPTRACAAALAGSDAVIWNHGGAAAGARHARMIDVIGPATTYWAGLADVLAALGADPGRVAVLAAQTGFGRDVAAGAAGALAAAGATPLVVGDLDAATAASAARHALEAGATTVIGCGRWEDDIALGHALAGTGVAVGLVACGVAAAAAALGPGLVGWFGPCQWLPEPDHPERVLGPGADYPAAQALAAGRLARMAVAAAGTADPDAVWDAARNLNTVTLLGPFAVDRDGRQVAHRPLIVRWARGPAGPVRSVAWRPSP